MKKPTRGAEEQLALPSVAICSERFQADAAACLAGYTRA